MPSRRAVLAGATTLAAGIALPLSSSAALAAPAPPPGSESGAAAPGESGPAYAIEAEERQSPIDIRTVDVVEPADAPTLVIDYSRADLHMEYLRRDQGDPAGCGVRRRDETVEAVDFVAATPPLVRIAGQQRPFRLVNFHFHIASEHRVDGRGFAMEQHFVHQRRRADGALDILVVGVLLGSGGSGTPQDRVLRVLPQECGPGISIAGVGLGAMLPADLTSYRYPGSLTTTDPATDEFTEGVRWFVMRSPVRVDQATIDRFRGLFPNGNRRAIQPTGSRRVRLTPGRRA